MPRFPILIFWAALLIAFVGALMPSPPQLPGAPSDKVQHIIAFAMLAVLARWAYPRTSLLKLLVGLSAFGALIEVTQGIPGLNRHSDPIDWLADTLAAAAILLIAALLPQKARS